MEKLINQRLEDIRKKHKLTRKCLEFISGFKERTIGSYERGEREVSKEYIEFISLYFGYTEDYIRGQKGGVIDNVVRIVKMYQSIYNYSDIKMSKILHIDIEDYKTNFNTKFYNSESIGYIEYKSNYTFKVLEKLNIKPSSVDLFLYHIQSKEVFFDNKIKNLKNRYNALETKGIEISPSYYASIIKQRNNPQTVTPNTQKETIPNKYKEILELLPYAPDSFIKTLKEKLETMKKVQEL